MHWTNNGAHYLALLRAVIERDGPTCWLCHQPINLALSRRSPLGLTLDHVIPRSKGGTNALTNLKAAHRACNLQRGARTPTRPRPVVFNAAFFRGPIPAAAPPAVDIFTKTPEEKRP